MSEYSLTCSSSVVVSFDPAAYTVTEGVDKFAKLMLVRTGNHNRSTIVSVATSDGSAKGEPKIIVFFLHLHLLPL